MTLIEEIDSLEKEVERLRRDLRMIADGEIAGMWCNARSAKEIAREALGESDELRE